ncbi:MAG: hypothetical protein ACC645_11825 [Pirellulales bacterium]
MARNPRRWRRVSTDDLGGADTFCRADSVGSVSDMENLRVKSKVNGGGLASAIEKPRGGSSQMAYQPDR